MSNDIATHREDGGEPVTTTVTTPPSPRRKERPVVGEMSSWGGKETPRRRPYKPRRMPQVTVEARFYSAPEIARLLGATRQAVYHLVHRNLIPYSKFGRLLRFDKEQIAAWLKGKRVVSVEGECK